MTENNICPIATQCPELYHCEHAKPHREVEECDLGMYSCKPCIKIPDMWLDKGGAEE